MFPKLESKAPCEPSHANGVAAMDVSRIPAASKQRTTSSLQPPEPRARRWIWIYVNAFGLGLLAVFVAAAWAMMLRISGIVDAAWWPPAPPWEWQSWQLMALVVCALPYILAFCASKLYQLSAFSHYDLQLRLQERSANPWLDDQEWRVLAERAEEIWIYESRRFSESRRMASLHGLIFGLVSSLTLVTCAMVVTPYLFATGPGAPDIDTSQRALVAIAVGTASAFAFAIDLGRIVFRVALRDAGAEIFSFATKNAILVVASALLLGTLLCAGLVQIGPNNGTVPLGVPGFIVIGATIAIVGGRAVRFVSDRAASVLGIAASRSAETSDLSQIEGLVEEDIARLAEEGVDSLHALAFIPLPRLLFNTKYGLERLCDWQDQALLLIHVGPAKARLLREHLLVRGAIGAQDASFRFFSQAQPPAASTEDSVQHKIHNLLGFATYDQARFAMTELGNDEDVNRLRVYVTAAHALEWANGDGDGDAAGASPR